MSKSDLSRREFSQLAVAAFGGVLAGTLAGCGGEPTKPAAETSKTDAATAKQEVANGHACRGLNTCKGKGKGGENECAGTGACATFAAHTCGGENECKGQGGCGPNPLTNDCRAQGHCAMPLMDHAWEKVRKGFEESQKAAGKEVGAAPAPTKT